MPFTRPQRRIVATDLFGGKYLGVGANATGGEPGVSSYSRLEVSSSQITVTDDSPSIGKEHIQNKSTLRFDDADDTAWGTVSHLLVYSQETGGDLLYSIPLTSPVTIAADDLIKFNEESIVVVIG